MSNEVPAVSKPQVNSKNSKPVYVNSIDGLRAICCLGVIFYHTNFFWAQGGLSGVTVFFVISGYLITCGLLSERGRSGGIDIKKFYVRRVRRLMPAAIVAIVGTATLCILFNHVLFTKMRPDIIPSLFMYINWEEIFTNQSYFQAAGLPSPLTPFWSLAIEWQFYLLWPPVLLLFSRLVSKRSASIVLLVLAALSAILMAVLYVPGQDPTRVYYGTDTRLMSIVLGCFLAFIWPFKKVGAMNASQMRRGRMFYEVMGFTSIIALILFMAFVDGYSPFLYYGGMLLISVVSVFAVAALVPQGTTISKIMGCKPLDWLGKRSYSMYLWHFPIIELLTNPNSATGEPWYIIVLMIALTLVAADLSYRYIEEPIRHGGWFKKLANTLNKMGRFMEGGVLPLSGRITAAVVSVCIVTTIAGSIFVPSVNAVGDHDGDARTTMATLKTPPVDGFYDLVFIGDSIMASQISAIHEVFPNSFVNARAEREPAEALEVYLKYADAGQVGSTVVFGVGTNAGMSSEQIEEIISAVGDDKKIWFITCRVPNTSRDDTNKAMEDAAARHSNVGVIDWHGRSLTEDDWFTGDGTHIRTGEASDAYVDLIARTINYVAPRVPTKEETTYSILFLGDGISIDAADELSTAFPRGAIDAAEGRGIQDVIDSYAHYLEQGVVGDNVVISMGSDMEFEEAEFQKLVDAIGPEKKIWLVNTRNLERWAANTNKILAALGSKYDNVTVIDWYATSLEHPEYFSGDAAHLSAEGRKAFADLVFASTETSIKDYLVAEESPDASNTSENQELTEG